MEHAIQFRNMMAEQGCEMTPNHAAQVLDSLESFRTKILKQSPEQISSLGVLSVSEKQLLRQQLSDSGKELTPSEVNDLIEFIICAYDRLN